MSYAKRKSFLLSSESGSSPVKDTTLRLTAQKVAQRYQSNKLFSHGNTVTQHLIT